MLLKYIIEILLLSADTKKELSKKTLFVTNVRGQYAHAKICAATGGFTFNFVALRFNSSFMFISLFCLRHAPI